MSKVIQEVAAAELEAKEAQDLAAALEERIRDGDESVTADELARAEGLGKFARLRVEAAGRKAAKGRRDAAIAEGKLLADELDDFMAVDVDLVQAWTEAVGAIRVLFEAARTRSQLVAEAVGRMASVDAQMQRDAGVSLKSVGVLPSRWGNVPGFRVPSAGVDVCDVAASTFLATALQQVVDASTLSGIGSSGADPRGLAESTLAGSVSGWPDAIRAVRNGPRV